MKITLKQAHKLQSKILEKVSSIQFNRRCTISLSTENPKAHVEKEVNAIREGVAFVGNLLEINFAIRKAVSKVNQESGINDLLTDIQAESRILNLFEDLVLSASGSNDVTLKQIESQLDRLSKAEQTYSSRDSVSFDIFNLYTEDRKKLAEGVDQIKLNISSLKDKVEGLNFNNHITLSEDHVKILKGNKLV